MTIFSVDSDLLRFDSPVRGDSKLNPYHRKLITPKHCKTPKTQFDRFIPNRSAMDKEVSHFQLVSKENTAPQAIDNQELQRSVANCLFSQGENSRILSFRNKPPENIKQDLSAMYAQARGESPKRQKNLVTRSLPQIPDKVLDAPGILDDFYLNLLDWSYDNVLAIGLGSCVYLWNAGSGTVTDLAELPENEYISSVAWVNGCNGGGGPTATCSKSTLAIGTSSAQIQLWDATRKTKIRTMTGHAARVGALSWNAHILSSGCRDGSIHHHDVRMPNHLVAQVEGHSQEVCGLRWSPDGTQIASGGNDNIVNIYDHMNVAPKYTKTQHRAAVKALSWCPWQNNLLATGGGTQDKTIRFWNTQSGACLNTVDTGSQVCSLVWNSEHKELASSHGFAENQITLWKYPGMSKIGDLPGHSTRVLHMAVSPDGQTIVSAAGDENLKFWKAWPASSGNKKKKTKTISTSNNMDNFQSLSIR